ncbi:MAG: Hpt domain-containing protein [Polyangiaceae bacterium]
MTPIDPKVKADALAELLPGFLQRRQDDVRVLREALAVSDFARVSEVGHKIRGNGATFGFPEITEIGERLEFAAKKHEDEHARREVDRLEKLIGELASQRP